VSFDDPHLVANAGLLLVGTLVVRLEIERLVNTTVCLAGRVGGALPGRKVLSLVHAMVAGASHIDHVDVLRAGNTAAVLPHRVMAPSTVGTFLRALSFGHVRQLEAVVGEVLRRAWALGAAPRTGRLVIDIDSTICEVTGKLKAGAAYGYTKVLGYHPILATRADTGEILQARMRKGSANTARGARRFIEELVARVRRAGATGKIVVRVDSGFWSNETIKTLGRLDVRYTMAVRTGIKTVAAVIAAIDPDAWVDIDYSLDGRAQVAETTYKGRRLIVRRTRLTDPHQLKLWPDWRHFAFLTDLDGDAASVDAFHREHATVELDIRDVKEGAGLEHVPSGNFSANSGWLQCAVLAHNLTRWTVTIGQSGAVERRTVAQTVRQQLINIPGRLVNHAGTPVLRGPLNWPWRDQFQQRLGVLRALEPLTG
jgi:hypothetical protein